jgi:hypothetical protein
VPALQQALAAMDDEKLFKKLRDLEALFAGATTPGERQAAGNARERILARLHTLEQQAPAVEYKFTMQDMWSKKLFLALLRRYDLTPYRYRGQRRTTVVVRVPQRFVDETLWPHFQRASQELRQHLDEVASKVIEQALDAKDTDADEEEREQPQQALPFAAEKG